MSKKKRPRSKYLLLAFILSLLLNIFFIFKTVKIGGSKVKDLSCTVSNVIDGDTFVCSNGDTIRLVNIDAPEYPKQCFSLHSKNYLTKLVNGKKVGLQEVGDDHFGRKVAFVFLDNININNILVKDGYARFVSKSDSPYNVELRKSEMEAKKLKKGIWSSRCQTHDPNCVIKGNVRRDRGTRFYHLPNCYNYKKIVVNEKEGDRWFCNEEEAVKAGFKKSSDCP